MRRRRGPSSAPILAVFAVLGAILGLALSVLAGGRLQTPDALQPQLWRTISPALDETVTNPLLGRGSQLVDGALVIREHAFHASDVLVPQLQGVPARVELDVDGTSGPVTLVLSTGPQAPRAMLTLTADRFSLVGPSAETWRERGTAGPWVVRSDPAGTVLVTGSGDALLVAHGLTGVELTTNGEEARVGSIVVYDADEQVIFADDFEGAGASPWVAVAGALLGALWGLAFAGAVLGGGGIGLPLVLAALPLVVLPLPESWWLQGVERLYLSRTPYWHLARAGLVLSLLPLGVVAVLRSGVLETAAGELAGAWMLWAGTGVVVTGLACRDLDGAALVMGIVGGIFVVAPALLAHTSRLHPVRMLAVDLPGLLALAVLGWPAGLVVLLGWRLLVLTASARHLLDHSPKAGSNAVLVVVVMLFPAAELALRATYLGEAWRMDRLTGEGASDADWRDAKAFWREACGPADAARTVSVAWAGGSSTGGAYQFHNDPTAFFPAQAHRVLCASLPPDTRLVSHNHGDGGRDTFTISRSISRLLERSDPDVLVLYVGVNDVMTSGGALSRKDRAAQIAAWTAGPLRQLASRSRVLTGLSLLVRQPREKSEKSDNTVPEVPLEDAEENLRRVATATDGRQVLLLTELLRSDFGSGLMAYTGMEQRVAQDFDHVHWFDLSTAIEPHQDASLMADRNHLSRSGGQVVGELLAPEVARLAGW